MMGFCQPLRWLSLEKGPKFLLLRITPQQKIFADSVNDKLLAINKLIKSFQNRYFFNIPIIIIIICTCLISTSTFAKPAFIYKIRTGIHPTFNRVVIESSIPVTVQNITGNNSKNIMVYLSKQLEIKKGLIEPQKSCALIQKVWATQDKKRTKLLIQLNRLSKIKSVFTLPASKGEPYRLAIDIMAVKSEQKKPKPSSLSKPLHKTPRKSEPVLPTVSPPCLKPPVLTDHYEAGNSLSRKLIIVDPGHGGIDPGSISPKGYYEKNITLAFAREIRTTLEATGRYTVILTRARDESVALRERFAIARDLGGQLFISLHADSNPRKNLKGFSLYTLSSVASDEEAQKLATFENKADILIGVDLTESCPETSNILIDLSQRDTLNQSIYLANCILSNAPQGYKLLTKAHRFADFAVLKAPDIPSVLVELGYLSNKEDEARLIDKKYQKEFAQILLKAVDVFFESAHKK